MHIFLRVSSSLLVAGGLVLGLAGAARGQQPTLRRVYPATAPAHDSLLRLGSTITLEVESLPLGPRGTPPTQNLTLYLNGVPLLGLAPLAVYTVANTTLPAGQAQPVAAGPGRPVPDSVAARTWPAAPAPGDSTALVVGRYGAAAQRAGTLTRVVFALRRDAAPGYWTLADGPPWQAAHSVHLGLGSAHQLLTAPITGLASTCQLAPAPGWQAGLVLAGLAGLLLLVAAVRSWLLRVPLPEATNADGQRLTVAEAAPPFSLARVQLAWWSFLVLGGGLISGCALGTLPAVPVAMLALLGVSVGTAVLAGRAIPDHTPGQPPQSRGWLADLLCDEQGLAIHRLLLVLVSLALGGGLVAAVYATGVLPAWPPSLALLPAFSSLAYLSPKWWQAYRAPATSLVPVATAAWPAPAPGWLPTPMEAAVSGSEPAVVAPPASAPPTYPVAPAPLPIPSISPQAVAQPLVAPTWPAEPASPVPLIPPAAPILVAAVLPPTAAPAVPQETAFTTQSLADPETGEVLYHEEEDMGPLEENELGLPEKNEYSN